MLGYAVIDTETTGLNIRGNDRVIEIAVVLMDLNLNITGLYETVLNPERDLGLVSLHGIDGLIASHGASFRDILPSLSGLLHDRVIIGHNVQFDIKMMKSEYEREDYTPDFGISVDTLRVAKSLPFYCKDYKLGTLCEKFNVSILDAHNAMSDALATATLLVMLLGQYPRMINCSPADFSVSPMSNDFGRWRQRNEIQETLSQPADLENHILSLHDLPAELPENSINTYLKTIHLALLNNRYSLWERDLMIRTISDLSLTRSQVIDLNEEYVFMLICKNLFENNGTWNNETYTANQISVAAAFGAIKDCRVEQLVQETLQQSHHIKPTVDKLTGYFCFVPGDTFVTTGEDLSTRFYDGLLCLELYLSINLGYVLKNSVTKSTKLVISSDPYSLSSKAVKARKYGMPILLEETLVSMLNLQID